MSGEHYGKKTTNKHKWAKHRVHRLDREAETGRQTAEGKKALQALE